MCASPVRAADARRWFDPECIARHGWLERIAAGRGATWLFRVDGQALVLRHFRRGGQVAKLLHDRYCWRGLERARAMAEYHLLARLHAWQLPVPAPFAARVLRRGLWYRCDLITRQLPTSTSLAERLGDGLDARHWQAMGRCIAALHRRRVWHADLNAHNVLLAGPGDSDPFAVYVVDFDRARIRSSSAWPPCWRQRNLQRLRRSLRKLSAGQFPERGWRALRSAYADALSAS